MKTISASYTAKTSRYITWSLLFLCLALQLSAAWQPAEFLLDRVVNDDTFYYLKIARNFARGNGLSFDGIHRTNGFQPLWMTLLFPLALIPSSPGLFLHIVLSVCAVLNLIAGLLIFRLLNLITEQRFALLGIAVYCHFMAFGIDKIIAVNGMESSLYFLTLCFALLQTMNITCSRTFVHSLKPAPSPVGDSGPRKLSAKGGDCCSKPHVNADKTGNSYTMNITCSRTFAHSLKPAPSPVGDSGPRKLSAKGGDYCSKPHVNANKAGNSYTIKKTNLLSPYITGLAWGLVVLTRLDTLLFILFLLIFISWQQRKRENPQANIKTLIVFAATIIPYFLWNILSFKHLIPISGIVKLAKRPALSFTDWNMWQGLYLTFLETAKLQLGFMVSWFQGVIPAELVTRGLFYGLISTLFAAGFAAYLNRRRSKPATPALAVLLILGVCALLHLFWLHVTLLIYTRYCTWYYIPFYLYLILWPPLSLYLVKNKLTSLRTKHLTLWTERVCLLLTAAAISLCLLEFTTTARRISQFAKTKVDHPIHPLRYRTALWIKDNLPEEAIYGAWNAGEISYFSERRVVPLDGLVNDYQFLNYLRTRNISAYLKQENIQYLIDSVFDYELENRGDFKGIPAKDLELIRKAPFTSTRALYIFAYKPNLS